MNIFKWFLGLFSKPTPIVITTTCSTSTMYSPEKDENFKQWLIATYSSVKKSKKSPKNYTVYQKTGKRWILSRSNDLHIQDSKLENVGNLYHLFQTIVNGKKD